MEDTIKTLRTFFRVSNALFEFRNSFQLAVSGYTSLSKMHQLHKIALNEIEKENPDLSLIDKLLVEMEITAEQAKSNSEQLVCQESELDCPYEFTSRCTIGRCNCKSKAN